MAFLPVPRLKSTSRPVAVALLLLLSAAAMGAPGADKQRKKIAPPKWKRVAVARANAARVAGNYYSSGSSHLSGATITLASDTLNFGTGATNTISAGNLVANSNATQNATLTLSTGVTISAALVKTGVGTLNLGSSVSTYTGGVSVTSGSLLTSGALLTLGSTINFGTINGITAPPLVNPNSILSGGAVTFSSGGAYAGTITMGAGTLNLSSTTYIPSGNIVFTTGTLSISSIQALSTSLIALINEGRATLPDGTAITVVVDPVTGEKSIVANGVTLPPPDAANPLKLIPKRPTVTSPTVAGDAPVVTTDSAAPTETLTGATLLTSSSAFTGGTLQINSAGTLTTSSATATHTIAAVPEPSSLMLALVGGGLLARRRRRG